VVAGAAREGEVRQGVGGWEPPLGIGMAADGLSAALVAMTAVVGAIVSLHARRSLGPEPGAGGRWSERDGFWPLWLFGWAALNALYLSRDVFNIYVALELLTVAAVSLVVLAGGREALTAGTRYLLAALLGSLAYLLGVALLYGEAGTLDVALIGERLEPGPAVAAAVTLMVLGLALKTALFPLHFWLPRAHASAAPPVSAVLSALVVKGSFYVILRLTADAFPSALGPPTGVLLGAMGAGAICFGSVQAIRQERLKLMIAYSTVAQVGYLFLLFPLAVPAGGDGAWDAGAFQGGSYQALAHGFAKAAMFLAAGNFARALGHDRIGGLAGVAGHAPASLFAFAAAGASLVGLPPTGGFIAKWLLLESSIASGGWWWSVVIAGGGLLTAIYVFPVVKRALTPPDGETRLIPVPRGMEWCALGLALGAVALGLGAAAPLDLIAEGRALQGEGRP
jgi:multicomponent Na+:H+ antiporter subunit D